ncbi:hypothetical protein ACJW31_02G180600 [Castanea mollissima]
MTTVQRYNNLLAHEKHKTKQNPKFFNNCCFFPDKITARKSFITPQPKPKGKRNPGLDYPTEPGKKNQSRILTSQQKITQKQTQEIKKVKKTKDISVRKQRMLINQRSEKRFIRIS